MCNDGSIFSDYIYRRMVMIWMTGRDPKKLQLSKIPKKWLTDGVGMVYNIHTEMRNASVYTKKSFYL